MPRNKRDKATSSETAELSFLFEPYVWTWFEDTFKKPSPPQTVSWPKIAEGKNTLILSPTGSGKTLAAFLWCINELFRMGSQGRLEDSVYVVYVSPLKALNNDIQRNLVQPLKGIKRYAQKLGIAVADVRSEVRTGDTSMKKRAEMVRRPPHILITTPESLFIILATKKFRLSFRKVKYVIVDEIHAIADNKRGVHLSLSLERLQHLVGRDLVRIGLSATQKPLDEIARFLVGVDDAGKPREYEIVDVGGRKNLNVSVVSPVDNLLEAQFDAIWSSAYDKMISMTKEHETTLIFTNSRYRTERAALRLNELGADSSLHVGAHHGSLARKVRLDMENKLKTGLLDALVATSSLELGIDVGSIDLVCQIQSPKSVSRGMQRIGRAGHLLDATSEGRLLVTDRDDLVESAVLVKAIMGGQIDTTRIPANCLDVLAQHIVGAVAADDWDAKELFSLCRRSYCYRNLRRRDYDRVLDMLSGNYVFDMEQPPYPKILWDKVNNVLSPERAARLMAFRASGTIPDIEDYDVYFEQRMTRVGQLDEGFVERLHTGDIFILGSASWRVLGFDRKRVIVEDVYGRAPTIPFWLGERDSRTYDLGVLVGRFRREMERRISEVDPVGWLQKEYYVDENGARTTYEYFKEQLLITNELPSDKLVLIEHFHDELGHQQIIVHSSFGVRVNDAWAMALCEAIVAQYGFRPQDATVDDGILITLPIDKEINPEDLLELVTPENVDELLEGALTDSPVFSSRFRHNAVRSLMVLRHYRDRRTPVWLQSFRSSALLEACREDKSFPLMVETIRECMNEALDVPNLREVLRGLESGEIKVKTIETKIPSPFAHSLLLLGQYGETGAIPTRERRSRLMHLRHEVLRQILDEETLRNLLDEDAIETVDSQAQYVHPHRKARNANELARVLLDLGDLVDVPDDDISLLDRTMGDALDMLSELASAHRAILVPITTVETNRERWISTENFMLYRGAFAAEIARDDLDQKIIQLLTEKGPLPLSQITIQDDVERRLDRLVNAYEILRLPKEDKAEYVASKAWIPDHILEEKKDRREARLALIHKFARSHGPVTKYEIMERYGFTSQFVEQALAGLLEGGVVAKGEYAPAKSFPQWCYKSNLERIHRLTLNRLRKEMEPATGVEYADFLIRWQHAHPDTQLAGINGLRKFIGQIQGQENYQAVFERDVFPSRIKDYRSSMLDRLCYSGEVIWRRFDYRSPRRGQIGFCLRKDHDWVVVNPDETEMKLDRWDEDIHRACTAVREFLTNNGACFFDDIVKGVGMDWRLVLRAIWHLVWTGEAITDSFESIRHADITTGLSGVYDLASQPQRKGATLDRISRQMLRHRKLDPRLGRWRPTERLVPSSLEQPDRDERMLRWADLLLKRYGIVSRESLELEVSAPRWGDLRHALVRMELLGKIRRGFFVEELSGEQFAYPEALEALRRAKLRFHGKDKDRKEAQKGDEDFPIGEPMVLLSSVDPASPFGAMFPATDEVGEEVSFARTPQRYLVIQAGQPVLIYERQGSIVLLVDLPIERARGAMATLMQIVDQSARFGSYREIVIRDWNGHPIDVSPSRYLLVELGFVEKGRKEFVYDGIHKPDEWVVAEACKEMPELFERAGKEKAPVKYDAEWIISRSPSRIQHKVRELIQTLERILPEEFEIVYQPRNFTVYYRGVRCLRPSIQQKRIRLSHFYHKDWWTLRPILIDSETNLNSPGFISSVLGRFEKSRRYVDSQLDRKLRPISSNSS